MNSIAQRSLSAQRIRIALAELTKAKRIVLLSFAKLLKESVGSGCSSGFEVQFQFVGSFVKLTGKKITKRYSIKHKNSLSCFSDFVARAKPSLRIRMFIAA